MGKDSAQANGTIADRMVVQQDLAGVFGCSPQEVSRLTLTGVLVRATAPSAKHPGQYRLGESIRRWSEYHLQRTARDDTERAMLEAKLRKAQAQAELATIKTREMEAGLVEGDALREFIRLLTERIRSSLIEAVETSGYPSSQKAQLREVLLNCLKDLERIPPQTIRQIASDDSAEAEAQTEFDEFQEAEGATEVAAESAAGDAEVVQS
jgi:hypothetical protein